MRDGLIQEVRKKKIQYTRYLHLVKTWGQLDPPSKKGNKTVTMSPIKIIYKHVTNSLKSDWSAIHTAATGLLCRGGKINTC